MSYFCWGGLVKTLQMILWLASMSFCLVFLLISVMSTMGKQSATASVDVLTLIEPMCFALACIALSFTPIRVISHTVRYLLAFGSTLLIGLYYFFVVVLGEQYTNHPNSSLFQMDLWVIITLVILVAYAAALFKADYTQTEQESEDNDQVIDPLFKTPTTTPNQSISEEIELEVGGSTVSNSQKRWRRTT